LQVLHATYKVKNQKESLTRGECKRAGEFVEGIVFKPGKKERSVG